MSYHVSAQIEISRDIVHRIYTCVEPKADPPNTGAPPNAEVLAGFCPKIELEFPAPAVVAPLNAEFVGAVEVTLPPKTLLVEEAPPKTEVCEV